MRNGFNTAGFSEVVHEITKDPREAKFVYTAKARRSELTGLSVQVLPALLGTVKSPRNFSFRLKDSWAKIPQGEAYIATPKDLFFTGIGSCMMTTLVGGASARHLALEGAELDLTPIPRDGSGNDEIAVSARFSLATSSEDSRCEQLVGRVAEQSPNYVTLAARTPVSVIAAGVAHPQTVANHPTTPSLWPSKFEQLSIAWVSGTQCLAHVGKPDSGTSLRVDAPKQLTGVDWGPNPQEYLLAGLASEMSSLLFQNSLGTPLEGCSWEVVATGIEDVRGFLGVDPNIEVGLQGVECRISPPTGSVQLIDDIVSQAVRDSEVTALLVNPVEVNLLWQRATDGDQTRNKLALRPGVGE